MHLCISKWKLHWMISNCYFVFLSTTCPFAWKKINLTISQSVKLKAWENSLWPFRASEYVLYSDHVKISFFSPKRRAPYASFLNQKNKSYSVRLIFAMKNLQCFNHQHEKLFTKNAVAGTISSGVALGSNSGNPFS